MRRTLSAPGAPPASSGLPTGEETARTVTVAPDGVTVVREPRGQ
ncbi:hypothetical protein [Streptomyces sp. PBH53]|nr:hypothetical protein [Streptomyces sp. PBH53]